MIVTTILADNLHCDACAAHVNAVLSAISDIVSVNVFVSAGRITVNHTHLSSVSKIISALKKADFKILDSKSVVDGNENDQTEVDRSSLSTTLSDGKALVQNSSPPSQDLQSGDLKHINYCAVCQAEHNGAGPWPKSSPNLQVSGHGAIHSDTATAVSSHGLELDLEAQRHTVDRVQLAEPDEGGKDDEFRAEISIGGMTCASCANSATAAIKELDFVKSATVTLLTNSCTVTFSGPRSNVDKIVEAIEDSGFDADPHSTTLIRQETEETSDGATKPADRTLSLKIEGMYCPECPNAVLDALSSIPSEQLSVAATPTLKNPILTIRYTPIVPDLTVRFLIAIINARRIGFKASVYHPPTIEDRSRAVQQRERRRLATRLLFSIAVSIPVFLIMIVFGTLVPSSNHIRHYFMTPIWNGNATREEWALFITTTPIMFYGADTFHRSAIKEITHLWRPGSPVPIWKRFYRFGSMNLLVSAGTAVAYFASLAMLIIHAKQRPDINDAHHTESYFDTVAFLTMFILCGRSLEAYSKAKTGDAVAKLGKLRPSEALLAVTDADSGESTVETVATDLLEIGDIVCVPSGGSPPADGLLQLPDSSSAYLFDESSLTGESKPAQKVDGDKIYAGSVNVDPRTAKIVVTDIGGTSLLDQIVNVVREGQMKRAPVERIADVITAFFVPVITFLAILVFIVWLSLGVSGALPVDYIGHDLREGGWEFWALKFAIAVFVVACPCGLALAAPTALFVGIGIAAKRGILVRGGGEAFQEATRLDAVIFDKTGTLTEGNAMAVSGCDVIVDAEDKESEMLGVFWTIANALEETSSHPKAKAIVDYSKDKRSSRVVITSSSISEVPGKGIRGTFELSFSQSAAPTVTYEASLGSRDLLDGPGEVSEALQSRLNTAMLRHESDGTTTAVLFVRRLSDSTALPTPVFLFAFSDPIRPESSQVISALHARNIEVYMCTGDNISTAKGVARILGIPPTHVVANVDPVTKAEFTGRIQRGEFVQSLEGSTDSSSTSSSLKKVVAFVGDGTNDSGALATADVGIAMSSGSDVALSAASFILLNCDLNSVLELVSISKRVINRVKYNFAWAAVYNVCLIPVAAGVFYPIVSGKQVVDGVTMDKHWRLDPAWASLAMALSSVSVVCSSLALRVEVRKSLGKLMFWRK